MMPPITGGAAFPTITHSESGFPHTDEPGLSVLDYFAGQALMGLFSNNSAMNTLERASKELSLPCGSLMAEACYTAAAAMIAERQKRMS